MVEMGRDKVYHLVYRLLTLALIMPVATGTIERVLSGMHLVKTELRNRIGDQWSNDSLIIYVEKEIFYCIDNAVIIDHFDKLKTSRENM